MLIGARGCSRNKGSVTTFIVSRFGSKRIMQKPLAAVPGMGAAVRGIAGGMCVLGNFATGEHVDDRPAPAILQRCFLFLLVSLVDALHCERYIRHNAVQ